MSVNATSSLDATASLASASASAGSSTSVDNEKRFYKLLVAQLNNQDPLNPLQNSEMTSQLAQMSTVTGIDKLNTTLQTLVNQSASGQMLQAASLVGRQVLVSGSAIQAGSDASAFAIEMPAAAAQVEVEVRNLAGELVRTMDVGALAQGLHPMSWDGKSDDGAAVAAGEYQIKVKVASGGSDVKPQSLVYSSVGSVTQSQGSVALDLASGQSVALSEVRMVR